MKKTTHTYTRAANGSQFEVEAFKAALEADQMIDGFASCESKSGLTEHKLA